MKDIATIVSSKVKEMQDSGVIEKMISECVEKSISLAITELFGRYGTIFKGLNDALSDGLKLNLADIDIQSYNQLMLTGIKARLNETFASDAKSKFIQELDGLLAPAPAEMSFNEFIETIARMWSEQDDDDFDEFATVEIETPSSSVMSDTRSVSIWNQRKSGYSYSTKTNCRAQIQLFVMDGKIRINHQMRFNPTCFNDVEGFIFKLYSAGTVLTGIDEFDDSDVDLSLKRD